MQGRDTLHKMLTGFALNRQVNDYLDSTEPTFPWICTLNTKEHLCTRVGHVESRKAVGLRVHGCPTPLAEKTDGRVKVWAF